MSWSSQCYEPGKSFGVPERFMWESEAIASETRFFLRRIWFKAGIPKRDLGGQLGGVCTPCGDRCTYRSRTENLRRKVLDMATLGVKTIETPRTGVKPLFHSLCQRPSNYPVIVLKHDGSSLRKLASATLFTFPPLAVVAKTGCFRV